MGRHPVLRNYLLPISLVITLIGLALVVLSYGADYGQANWTDPYEELVPSGTDGDWNLMVRVISPVVLLIGLWYAGEQLIARRRFDRLIDADKKSEFQKNMPTLEETARNLPERYEAKLDEKQRSFKSRR